MFIHTEVADTSATKVLPCHRMSPIWSQIEQCQYGCYTHTHAPTHTRPCSERTVTMERKMASFAPTSSSTKEVNAIWALLRRQLTLISLITGFSENQNLSRLPPSASIWSNWFNHRPQGCVQTGPIGAIRFSSVVASKFESGRHNDIIITSYTNHWLCTYLLKHFLSPPTTPIVIEQQNQLAHPDLSS